MKPELLLKIKFYIFKKKRVLCPFILGLVYIQKDMICLISISLQTWYVTKAYVSFHSYHFCDKLLQLKHSVFLCFVFRCFLYIFLHLLVSQCLSFYVHKYIYVTFNDYKHICILYQLVFHLWVVKWLFQISQLLRLLVPPSLFSPVLSR